MLCLLSTVKGGKLTYFMVNKCRYKSVTFEFDPMNLAD